MNSLIVWFKGKKTYIISALMIAYAISGMVLGYIPQDVGVQMILTALGFGAIRNAIQLK